MQKRRSRRNFRDLLVLELQLPELDVQMDAGKLAALATQKAYDLHAEAVQSGKRASDGVGQQPLSPTGGQGRRAARGERPNVRGITGTGDFPDSLDTDGTTKRRLRASAGKDAPVARGRVAFGSEFDRWLIQESARGSQYLFGDGAVYEALLEVLQSYVDDSVRRANKG